MATVEDPHLLRGADLFRKIFDPVHSQAGPVKFAALKAIRCNPPTPCFVRNPVPGVDEHELCSDLALTEPFDSLVQDADDVAFVALLVEQELDLHSHGC